MPRWFCYLVSLWIATATLLSAPWANRVDERLIDAASMGRIDEVRKLLAKVNINGKNTDGDTALILAALRRQAQVVNLLVAHGADVNAKGRGGNTALMRSAGEGSLELVKTFLANGANVNATNDHGDTALMWAVAKARPLCVEPLLNSASVNFADINEVTPLMVAARSGNPEIIAMLLSAGAAINRTATDGSTALMEAAAQGSSDNVKELLNKGAGVNDKDHRGQSALHWAAMNGKAAAAEALTGGGAEVNRKDHGGSTPLMKALTSGETARLLLDIGADPDAKDNIGYTPLMRAVLKGADTTVEILVARGADINAKGGPHGLTALSLSVTGLLPATVQFLKDHGAQGPVLAYAKLIRDQPRPIYPPKARQARIVGALQLEGIISKEGAVKHLKLVSGNPIFEEAARGAVLQWLYEPARVDGEPIESETLITVNFTLSQ